MQVVAARSTEEKYQVHELCSDFGKAVLKPQDVVFDYVSDGGMTLVVSLLGGVAKKAALMQLSEQLTRMAREAAALASAIPDEPVVVIDEQNKAASDP